MSNTGYATAVLERNGFTSITATNAAVNRSNQTLSSDMENFLERVQEGLFVETEDGSSRTNLLAESNALATSRRKFIEGFFANPGKISRVSLLFSQPVGTPFNLTKEEADEVIDRMFGSRKDLPSGKEFVRNAREQLGRSIVRRSQQKNA